MLSASPRRQSLTIDEHRRIVRAIASKDADQAATAMRNHIDAVMVEIRNFAKKSPHLFADGETHFSQS
jgi:DNA-binding GntR family transcriptional regulator